METWLGYHDGSLYVATRVRPSDMARLRRAARKPSTDIWENVEIFIDPALGWRDAFHVGFDPAGRRVQERGKGKPWNGGQWQVATHVGREHWTAEARFSLSELASASAVEAAWGINVYRGKHAGGEPATLSPVFGSLRDPARFARLTGLTYTEFRAAKIRLEIPRPLYTGSARIRAKVSGGSSLVGRKMDLMLVSYSCPPGGTQRVEKRLPLKRADASRARSVSFDIPVALPGTYRFHAQVLPAGAKPGKGTAIYGTSRITFVTAVKRDSLHARTDRNYYTSERRARIRCRFFGKGISPGSHLYVTVRPSDGGAPLPDDFPAKTRHRVDGSPFVVSIPLTGLPAGEFRLDLTLCRPDLHQLAETTVPLIRRLPRHNDVKIRWDNVLIVHDEPFFPIWIWNNEVLQALELGCNSILWYWPNTINEDRLVLARRFGIHIIARPSTRNEPVDAAPKVRWLRDEPTFLAWIPCDEPKPLKGRPKEYARKLTAAIRQLDPRHPIYIQGATSLPFGAAYSQISDITGSQAYASHFCYNETTPGYAVEAMAASAQGRQPVWPIIQTFKYRWTHDHPSLAEFRHSAYAAVIHGAKGIGLWGSGTRCGGGSEDIRGLQSDKALWHEVKRVVRELRRLSPVLTSEERVQVPAAADNEHVSIMSKRFEGSLYVWLANGRAAPERVSLRLPVSKGTLINEIPPGGRFPLSEGKCRLDLAPLQPMVLRLER